MRIFLTITILLFFQSIGFAQMRRTELFDLIRKFIPDSTGFENVGDWAVGRPKMYPVAWKNDRVEMSSDTSINFFRSGIADITLKKKAVTFPAKWRVMLKGPRSGYTSFTIISPVSANLKPVRIPDSIFGSNTYKLQLLRTCNNVSGFNYYKLMIPGKDVAYLKVSWQTKSGQTSLRIDGYDSWSKYAVKLNCP